VTFVIVEWVKQYGTSFLPVNLFLEAERRFKSPQQLGKMGLISRCHSVLFQISLSLFKEKSQVSSGN
ncbi:MAG: hypothetical protein C4323_01500, partial [Mastigocladus sp. ERB_26_2]